jgi:hypothetical protein
MDGTMTKAPQGRRGANLRGSPAVIGIAFTLLTACGSNPTPQSQPPLIVKQPSGLAVSSCSPANFDVIAAGTEPLAYQWLRNGQPIADAHDSSYVLPAPEPADSGAVFSVSVSNSAGALASQPALLSVAPPGPPSPGPATIVSEGGTSVGVSGNFVVWTTVNSVHATSAQCPGAFRSIFYDPFAAPAALLIVGSAAYWVDANPGGGGVWGTTLGSGEVNLLARTAFEIGGFGSSPGMLTWTDTVGLEIQTVSTAGGKVTRLGVAPATGRSGPGAIATDGSYFYYSDWNGTAWADVRQMSSYRLPLAGGVPEVLASTQGVITDIAVDGPDVYWISTGDSPANSTTFLRRMGSGGGAIQELAARPDTSGGKLIVDAEFLYWTTSAGMTPTGPVGTGSLERVPKDGTAPSIVLAGGLTFAAGVATDDLFIYWTEFAMGGYGQGRVGRIAK